MSGILKIWEIWRAQFLLSLLALFYIDTYACPAFARSALYCGVFLVNILCDFWSSAVLHDTPGIHHAHNWAFKPLCSPFISSAKVICFMNSKAKKIWHATDFRAACVPPQNPCASQPPSLATFIRASFSSDGTHLELGVYCSASCCLLEGMDNLIFHYSVMSLRTFLVLPNIICRNYIFETCAFCSKLFEAVQ